MGSAKLVKLLALGANPKSPRKLSFVTNPPTVWFFREGPPAPCHPSVTLSKPNLALPLYPSCVPTWRGYMSVLRFAVLRTQVDDWLAIKTPPRICEQSEGSVEIHPSGSTTKVWYAEVDGKTFTTWPGVPIWRTNDDQLPSLPSPIQG